MRRQISHKQPSSYMHSGLRFFHSPEVSGSQFADIATVEGRDCQGFPLLSPSLFRATAAAALLSGRDSQPSEGQVTGWLK